MFFSALLSRFLPALTKKKKRLEPDWKTLEQILGFAIRDKEYYRLALIDPSTTASGNGGKRAAGRSKTTYNDNNDRLEFLGDSIIGAVVSETLYRTYPNSPVGALSEQKAKIVSRKIGDTIAKRMGIDGLIQHSSENFLAKDAPGNALEAIVGAIYLDRGFDFAHQFVNHKMLGIYREIRETQPDLGTNFKNKLIEWGLKHKCTVEFRLIGHAPGPRGYFVSQVFIDNQPMGHSKGSTKKGSEQGAAKLALEAIESDKDFLKSLQRNSPMQEEVLQNVDAGSCCLQNAIPSRDAMPISK